MTASGQDFPSTGAWPGEVVNLAEKFGKFSEQWSPRVVGALNGQLVKLARLEGEFVWHAHADEDELFLVISGRLLIRLRDRVVTVKEGEFFIVPRGVEHCPVAEDEALVLLLEPASTAHTGEISSERTVSIDRQRRI